MDGLFTIGGVLVGAAVAILSPIISSQWQKRVEEKQLLKALLVELQENEQISRTVVEEKLLFDYLSNSMNFSSYEKAKASGVLADMPSTILNNLISTYEIASRFNDLWKRKQPMSIKDMEKFNQIYDSLPEQFKSTAEVLRQYVKK